MTKAFALTLALSFSLLSPLAHAAAYIKPGLWEVTTQSAEAKELPQMSPEQNEQLRKLGVDIAKLQSGVIVANMCITKEMTERGAFPQIDQAQSGCKLENIRTEGNTHTADLNCNNQSMRGKGTIRTAYANDESFTTSLEFSGVNNGRQIAQDRSNASGKWLRADCGDVKATPSPRK